MDVKLEAYEGPLDLLLSLIQRHEIDIYDIPISTLTTQYLQEVANLPPDMERLSEFLVMAATLLEIKTKMLLPRKKTETEEEYIDPREALVQKLIAYKQAQDLAFELNARTPIGERIIGIGDRPLLKDFKQNKKTDPYQFNRVELPKLMEIFLDVMSRREGKRDRVRANFGRLPRDVFTVTEKVEYVRHILKEQGQVSLRKLFLDCRSKNEMVVTFLAILEMVRQGMALAHQSQSFSDVEISTLKS